MAGSLNKLTAKEAAAITTPGRHADGGNLFLRVRPSGSKTWTFLYERTVLDPATGAVKRKQTEIVLGPYGSEKGGLTLAEAREQAIPHRKVLADKGDPLEVMRAREKAAQAAKTTFADFVKEYLDAHRAGWSNSKHAKQWETTLGPSYCKLLQGKPIADIGVAEILEVLTPIWSEKPETARRIRMRLERILDAAKVKGLRTGENPARWRGHLDHLLKKHRAEEKGHHAAMAFTEVPAFMTVLTERSALAALALRFLILTATRTTETLAATWDEFDLKEKVWTIPKTRMKNRKPHRIPLSDAALEILASVRGGHEVYVFGGSDGRLSQMSLLMLLRRLGREDVTVHGFRSSFRDWVSEATSFSPEAAEKALAHTVANATEAAYRRGDLLEKRKPMMDAWARYCTAAQGKVVALRHA